MQLAALSLRRRSAEGAIRFVQTFAGAKQHVFAYLMDEVLSYQTPEMRQFLQQTAVLQQFSLPCARPSPAAPMPRNAWHI